MIFFGVLQILVVVRAILLPKLLANFILRNHHATSSSATQTSHRVCHTATISSVRQNWGGETLRRGLIEGKKRNGTARGTPSSSAWWRSAAPTMTAKTRSAAKKNRELHLRVAADEEPLDGRRGYTVKWSRQGQWLPTNTRSLDGRRGYIVQQCW